MTVAGGLFVSILVAAELGIPVSYIDPPAGERSAGA